MDCQGKCCSETQLNGVERTCLITLMCRAVESRKPSPAFVDRYAVEIIDELGLTLENFKVQTPTIIGTAIRTLMFDQVVSDFFMRHPDGQVLNVGAGLDGRFLRLDNGSATWIDLDFPDVIALRRRFYQEGPRQRNVTHSVLAEDLFEVLNLPDGPMLVVMEGVAMYLPKEEIIKLFGRFQKRGNVEMVFDAVSTYWTRHWKKIKEVRESNSPFLWGSDNPLELEQWLLGLKVLSGRHCFDPELKYLWPLSLKVLTLIPWFRRSICNYVIHIKL